MLYFLVLLLHDWVIKVNKVDKQRNKYKVYDHVMIKGRVLQVSFDIQFKDTQTWIKTRPHLRGSPPVHLTVGVKQKPALKLDRAFVCLPQNIIFCINIIISQAPSPLISNVFAEVELSPILNG